MFMCDINELHKEENSKYTSVRSCSVGHGAGAGRRSVQHGQRRRGVQLAIQTDQGQNVTTIINN